MSVFAPSLVPVSLSCGRLTTESGVAVSTSDRASQSTVYFTPFRGNQIALYSGSGWLAIVFSEVSLALSGLTSGKNYDVFGYESGGGLALELSAAWSSDAARAEALTLQDGVLVKSGAATRRYLGTLRTTGTTTTEDSRARRFVWNAAARVLRPVFRNSSASYTYNSSTTRQMNADTANQVELVAGLQEEVVALELAAPIEINVSEWGTLSIGENSTTTAATDSSTGTVRDFTGSGTDNKRVAVTASLTTLPRLGYSQFTMLEAANGGTIQLVGAQLRGTWPC